MTILKTIGGFFRGLWVRFVFVRNQGARVHDKRFYFVDGNGSIRRRFPTLHMSKKRRLGLRQPAKLRKFVEDSQAALVFARDTLEHNQTAFRKIHAAYLNGKGWAEALAICKAELA